MSNQMIMNGLQQAVGAYTIEAVSELAFADELIRLGELIKRNESIDGKLEKMIDSDKLRDMVLDGLHTDGGHHKQWFLMQIAKMFDIEYDEDKVSWGRAP